jgi:hypothetical protein
MVNFPAADGNVFCGLAKKFYLDKLRAENFANDFWPPEPETGQTILNYFWRAVLTADKHRWTRMKNSRARGGGARLRRAGAERGLSPIRSAGTERDATGQCHVIRFGESAASWDNSRSAGVAAAANQLTMASSLARDFLRRAGKPGSTAGKDACRYNGGKAAGR